MASTTLITKFAHLQIPLEDVLNATVNFHDDNIIGRGGLGLAYKGQLQRSGNLIKIAALRLDRKHGQGNVEFWTEISMLSDLKHTNIVSLIGFCDEKDEKIIITTYMAKGSLKEHLSNQNLPWTQRLKICVGVARALSYLHYNEGRGYGVIHLNINSSTILLDENWEAKLSGFKVSIKQSLYQMDRVILSEPIGTIGYVDPEIEKTKGVTQKSDIYSFGVVLFEILCGRRAYIRKESNSFLARLAKYHYENETLHDIIYPDLRNQMSLGSLKIYSKIAYSCLKEERAQRPHMLNIVDELEKALKFRPQPENFEKTLEDLKIPLSDIKLATNNFSSAYKKGFDGYFTLYKAMLYRFDEENNNHSSGEEKYKGEHSEGRKYVIIKRYPSKNKWVGEQQFFTEIEMLTTFKHPNIVTLLGFCNEGSEMITALEISNKGNLCSFLGNVKSLSTLTWEKRLKICIDVAHALNYLHCEMENQRIITNYHICSSNIGLDDNFKAKIIPYTVPPNRKHQALYLESFNCADQLTPEYNMARKSKLESDVYYFGEVLFEILCGRANNDPIYHKESSIGLVHLARQNFYTGTLEDMIDPTLAEETSENKPNNSLHTFIEIANQCVAETQDQRPTMQVVVNELKKALYFQVERIQLPNTHQVVNKHEKLRLTHEVPPFLSHTITTSNPQRCTNSDRSSTSEPLPSLRLSEIPSKKDEVVGPIAATGRRFYTRIASFVHDLGHATTVEPLLNFDIRNTNLSMLLMNRTNTDIGTGKELGTHEDSSRAELQYYDKESNLSKRYNTVLIKRYTYGQSHYGEKEFRTEIEILSNVKHPNIVTLLGFCHDTSELILVFENFSNGFLSHYLENTTINENGIFTWEKRLKICIDVAHALNYIHFKMEDQKMIINGDISCYNIGLDENWGAKIVHFWCSVIMPSNQEVMPLNQEDKALYLYWYGRKSYTDPEYEKTGNLKRESDVYSFGVVLLEILCGRLAYDPIYLKESDKGLAYVARQNFFMGILEDMIDPIIKDETDENNFVLNKGPNKNSLHKFIEIALSCVAETQDQRPTMKVVVKELEKALFLQKNNNDNPKMSLEDIKRATENFHDDNCIGGGGFGKVYKGNLEAGDGFKTIVAKRLDTRFGQGEQQFLCELQILLDYKHTNVIDLVGYCDKNDEKIIVYEYASKGSLDGYLNDASLTWVKRLNICIDVGRALDFLHGGVGKHAKVIHRDIKTANILLNDDWEAKLADFGLSLVSPLIQETDYVIDHACGTAGYLDPLYRKLGFLTIESDIYSFGVVLFEILCGRSTFAIWKHEGHYLPEFIKNRFEEGKHDEVVFEQIREEIVPKSLTTFQEIAYQCLHLEREKRPTTKEVLTELKKALEFQLNSEVKSEYVEEKRHASIIETQVVELSSELNNMNIIGKSETFEIYNKEKMLLDQTNNSN